MSRGINNHRRAQSNNDFQQILCNKIAGFVEGNSLKSHKNQSFGNLLFQIPEQTDIASSTEQTINSAQKNYGKDILLSNTKNYSQDQKENQKNQNLITQIQYMVKSNHPIKEITQKAINSERKENNKQLSFTNELQKKYSQNQQQYNTPHDTSNMTPDRKKVENTNNKLKSQKQKSDQQNIEGSEKSKVELSSSLLNSLLKVDHKKKSTLEKQESFKKMEIQMNKIQKDIYSIKQRQDQLDEFNRNMQNQLYDFITENKKQQDYGHQSLKKLEQLEQITRRNEESIKQLKDSLLCNQQINYKGNENVLNFGNLSLFKQENQRHSKFSDLKSFNKVFY